jgi:hypothetical protein
MLKPLFAIDILIIPFCKFYVYLIIKDDELSVN